MCLKLGLLFPNVDGEVFGYIGAARSGFIKLHRLSNPRAHTAWSRPPSPLLVVPRVDVLGRGGNGRVSVALCGVWWSRKDYDTVERWWCNSCCSMRVPAGCSCQPPSNYILPCIITKSHNQTPKEATPSPCCPLRPAAKPHASAAEIQCPSCQNAILAAHLWPHLSYRC